MIMDSLDQGFRQGTPWKAFLCSLLSEAVAARCKGILGRNHMKTPLLILMLLILALSREAHFLSTGVLPCGLFLWASVNFFTAWWLVSPKASISKERKSQVEAVPFLFTTQSQKSNMHHFCHTLIGVVRSLHPNTREGNIDSAFW